VLTNTYASKYILKYILDIDISAIKALTVDARTLAYAARMNDSYPSASTITNKGCVCNVHFYICMFTYILINILL
jgi:hypothetical protein